MSCSITVLVDRKLSNKSSKYWYIQKMASKLFGIFSGIGELKQEVRHLDSQIQYCMSQLTRQVKRRDRLRHRKERQYNLVTAILQASSQKRSKYPYNHIHNTNDTVL